MRLLMTVLVIVFVGGGALWLAQRRLIYLPSGQPGAAPVGWSSVTFSTGDGLQLAGWFHSPVADAAIVIVFNGNAGNRSDRIELGSRLAAAGLGVVLFDYRGYGDNPGAPSEEGLAADASAVGDWVADHHPGRPVGYFGESLGAAVAVRLATERPPAALVLRSPFTSLADVAAVHYPFLPVRGLLWDAYPSIDRIAEVSSPLVIVAGSADSIVPPEQSRSIYEAAPGSKSWLLIDGADHNDLALTSGDQVVAAIVDALS
jgi:fermentation-respiration switch protein FrsA (DUF1100 family)